MNAMNQLYVNPLTDNFIARLDRKPIATNRYIWHVKYEHYASDLLIAKNGLICPANFAVFAHNNATSFDNLYPYFLDKWEMGRNWFLIDGFQFTAYSFWRIDTLKANTQWYLDPNMTIDAEMLGFNPQHYVCALNPIPSSALKLFKINLSHYANMPVKLKKGNGVVSVSPFSSDFEALEPVKIYTE